MQRGEYILVSLEQLPNSSVRARICGPGTGAGVWYWVPTAEDAAALVNDLNVCYSSARELKWTRECHRRENGARVASDGGHLPAA